MFGLILIAGFFVGLIVIGVVEEWQKSLKIFGVFVGSLIILAILEMILGVERRSSTAGALSIIFWGIWDLYLFFYCFMNRYINNNKY